MNIKTIITGAIGAGLLAGSLYVAKPDEYKYEPIKLIVTNTSSKTQQTISPSFGDPRTSWTENNETPSIEKKGGKIDGPYRLLDEHPTLRERIQNMSWYQNFSGGVLPQEIFYKYLTDALSIEEKLLENPGLIEKIQYEKWWQRYIRGEINPTDMLSGNMEAFLDIERLIGNDRMLYELVKQNPNWNLGIQQGEDFVVVGQREFLISVAMRIEFLDTHPDIESLIKERGFTRDHLFTDDWSKGEGIYGLLYTVEDGMENRE